MSAESNCAFLLPEGTNGRKKERERAGLNRAEKYHTHRREKHLFPPPLCQRLEKQHPKFVTGRNSRNESFVTLGKCGDPKKATLNWVEGPRRMNS